MNSGPSPQNVCAGFGQRARCSPVSAHQPPFHSEAGVSCPPFRDSPPRGCGTLTGCRPDQTLQKSEHGTDAPKIWALSARSKNLTPNQTLVKMSEQTQSGQNPDRLQPHTEPGKILKGEGAR